MTAITGGPAGSSRIGFKHHLRVEVVPGDAAYLFSEQGVTALRGDHIEEVAPLLDGTRDLTALLSELNGPAAERLGGVLGALDRAGLLAHRPGPAPATAARRADEAYWELAGLDGSCAADLTAAGRVALRGAGGVSGVPDDDVRAAADACRAAGLVVGDDSALTLVLCDDYLSPALGDIDAEHRAAGRPWLLAKPGGTTPWIGPLFQPPATAPSTDPGPCWHCLTHRLRAHRTSELPVRQARGLTGPVPQHAVSTAASRATALQLCALEATKWLAGHRHEGQSAIWTLDTLTLSGRRHPVDRRPQCPECGDAGLVARRLSEPVVFRSRPKATGSGSNHRALSSRQVMDRYGSLVSPLTGAVQEIRRDERGPAALNCFVSGRNLATTGSTLSGLRAGLRTISGGKGVTALDAEVSALCEALERYSGSLQGDEPRVRDTLNGLGDAAVHPETCLLFHPRQYRDRDRWNARNSLFQQVTEEFDRDAPVDWTPVWSVTGQRHRLLPTSMLYYDGRADSATHPVAGSRFAHADSNGNAAGSSIEDAVLQGFLELVERDAVALWWYNRTRHPAVSFDRFGDSWTDEIRSVYASMNREVWALDLTSDFGIPVFAALSRRTDKAAQDIMFGFGAHFDPRFALRRALTEMNQLIPAVAGATADGGGYALRDPEPVRWWQTATTANQAYLTPDPAAVPRTPEDFGYRPRSDLRDDLRAAEELVRERGLELLVLDQTRPDIGLPVVKVIVPGLRHFWARFAPGRLYDVPVRLGRLNTATAYENLNPIPLFV